MLPLLNFKGDSKVNRSIRTLIAAAIVLTVVIAYSATKGHSATLPEEYYAASNQTGNEDHDISWAQAKQLVDTFKRGNQGRPYAWYFSKKAVLRVLDQTGAIGIRIYGGHSQTGVFRPVLVGVTADGDDLDGGGLGGAFTDTTGFQVLEQAFPCPPLCPPE